MVIEGLNVLPEMPEPVNTLPASFSIKVTVESDVPWSLAKLINPHCARAALLKRPKEAIRKRNLRYFRFIFSLQVFVNVIDDNILKLTG